MSFCKQTSSSIHARSVMFSQQVITWKMCEVVSNTSLHPWRTRTVVINNHMVTVCAYVNRKTCEGKQVVARKDFQQLPVPWFRYMLCGIHLLDKWSHSSASEDLVNESANILWYCVICNWSRQSLVFQVLLVLHKIQVNHGDWTLAQNGEWVAHLRSFGKGGHVE